MTTRKQSFYLYEISTYVLTEGLQLPFQNDKHYIFVYIYTYFLLEMRPIFLTSSIYITVFMAKQRFNAIQNPVQYHINAQLDSKRLPCRALSWIFGLELAAFLVSIPLFLEPMVLHVTFTIRDNINKTHMILVSTYLVKIVQLFCHYLYFVKSISKKDEKFVCFRACK